MTNVCVLTSRLIIVFTHSCTIGRSFPVREIVEKKEKKKKKKKKKPEQISGPDVIWLRATRTLSLFHETQPYIGTRFALIGQYRSHDMIHHFRFIKSRTAVIIINDSHTQAPQALSWTHILVHLKLTILLFMRPTASYSRVLGPSYCRVLGHLTLKLY